MAWMAWMPRIWPDRTWGRADKDLPPIWPWIYVRHFLKKRFGQMVVATGPSWTTKLTKQGLHHHVIFLTLNQRWAGSPPLKYTGFMGSTILQQIRYTVALVCIRTFLADWIPYILTWFIYHIFKHTLYYKYYRLYMYIYIKTTYKYTFIIYIYIYLCNIKIIYI